MEVREFAIGGYPALALWGDPALAVGISYVSFTGDFGFHRAVPPREAIEAFIAAEASLLARFDLRVVNLEFLPDGRLEGFAAAEALDLELIERLGFDLVSLSNNHSFDRGNDGLDHVVGLLHEHGLPTIGLRECARAEFLLGGVRVAFVSGTDLLDAPDRGGRVMRCGRGDTESLTRERRDADVFVAFPHLGSRSIYPGPHEIEIARWLVAGGCDAVIATGSHFAKGVVEVDGRPVCYSLGNYVFGWDGGDTEPIGMHLVLGLRGAAIEQVFVVPFRNALLRGDAGPLQVQELADFASRLVDRSTDDPARFFADPRTRAGILKKLRSLRRSGIRHLRPYHFEYAARAIWSRLRGR